ncbi:MAG TPA: hypothetical protein VES65_10470 [Solirubrobacteraceae bacterium]|nr:hypothetical protein [Solirubrobacteraceae bacterium]
MSSNLPMPRQSLIGALLPAAEDRAVARRYSQIQRAALVQRAHDVAERDLRQERMSDIGQATRHGMTEGSEIADDLARRVERNPLALCLSGIAEDGIEGIREELRGLRRGGR